MRDPLEAQLLTELFGWKRNDEEVARILSAKSGPMLFADAAPHLKGYWQGEDLKLWQACKKVNQGNNLPADSQKIGDCVSHGTARAVDYLWCTKQASGLASGYQEGVTSCKSEVVYGEAREIGHDLSMTDGAVGIWAIEALQKFGFVPRNSQPYDGNLAKKYGYQGVPQSEKDSGRIHLLDQYSKIQSVDDYASAMKAGSPVIVCSDQGFTMSRDSNGICQPSGTWNHCMVHIGLVSIGSTAYSTFVPTSPGQYGVILQSWGQNVPNGSVPCGGDAPDNSFLASLNTIARMLSQGDSFAPAAIQGWKPLPPLDWVM